ncbi:MAG: GTPase HflX [Methylacidiphilales bacterium]|nr:GTPase HflX [Candidatus Methylacidiphilales bacterium]
MFEIKEKPKMVESAVLVGMYTGADDKQEAQSLLDELGELTCTLGIPIAESLLVNVREPHARLYMGSGKAEEIAARARELKSDVIIFDNDLSPAQQRNWETLSKLAVIDRQEVILDIFGKRAQTREARLQVQLARLEYSLPRLTRAWSHFGQQAGGIGGKGEGETQLEIDRRLMRKHIERLKRELIEVKRSRATQRKERKRVPVPNAAIVGYTNAGKSSLLRLLTGAQVLVEDKLFATLDTTTRRVSLPNNQPLLLTDTVGFVRKLPHRLIEAFNATLEESVQADFLIHVLDCSHPRVAEFHATTLRVLEELGAGDKPSLTLLNKADKLPEPADRKALLRNFPDALFISILNGEGIEELKHRMAGLVGGNTQVVTLNIPQSESSLIARLHREAKILSTEYAENDVHMSVLASSRLLQDFSQYVVPERKKARVLTPKRKTGTGLAAKMRKTRKSG